MHSQKLKRQTEDVSYNNDELDVTFSNKKTRYLYTYSLQSPDLFTNINDSDQTESVYSFQSKSTIEVADDHSSSSSSENQNSGQSDTSEIEDIRRDVNNGYTPDDTDIQVTTPETNILIPACFDTCLMCKKKNCNPHFQFCYECFRYRKQLSESKSDRIPKRIKRLNTVSNCSEASSPYKNSQESCQSNSQGSFGISGLCLSQESSTNTFENDRHSCNVCLLKPKNGIFNHGKTSHVYCCYSCAKKIWSRSGKCPICKLKIRYVTKAITVNV